MISEPYYSILSGHFDIYAVSGHDFFHVPMLSTMLLLEPFTYQIVHFLQLAKTFYLHTYTSIEKIKVHASYVACSISGWHMKKKGSKIAQMFYWWVHVMKLEKLTDKKMVFSCQLCACSFLGALDGKLENRKKVFPKKISQFEYPVLWCPALLNYSKQEYRTIMA